MKYRKVLITGGMGYVGGRLAQRLSRQFELVLSSRKKHEENPSWENNQVTFIEHQQLLDSKSFPAGIDVVIHLAALNEIDCVKSPSEAITVNIDQTRQILENAITHKVCRFVYFSTVHVYGSPLIGSITESDPTRPLHPYAITHRAAEDYVIAATEKKQIRGEVIRLSNSFGAPVTPDVNRWTLLVNDLCRQAAQNKELRLNSNGCQFRDFITLSDVAAFVAFILENDKSIPGHIVNLVSGRSLTVLEMANLVSKAYENLTGNFIPVLLPENSKPSVEREVNFSTERMVKIGYTNENEFTREIEHLVEFCMKHFNSPVQHD